MLRVATTAALACLLTACNGSTTLRGPLQLGSAPGELTRPCPDPEPLPGRALSAGAVERAWARDRANLVACRDRHGAVVRFYEDRDSKL